MSDGIVPAVEFGHAAADRAAAPGGAPANGLSGSYRPSHQRRALDLRRTESPGPGEMPSGPRKHRHRRCYAVVMLDSDGRLSDQQLFSQLGWAPGTRVDIGVGDGHEIVVRRDEEGAWALTSRNMVLVPAPLRRWCGYGSGDAVLVVAVSSMSAVVLHNLEALDQALPDPRKIVADASRWRAARSRSSRPPFFRMLMVDQGWQNRLAGGERRVPARLLA